MGEKMSGESKLKICLFSLSKKDPTFRSSVSIKGPIEWLNSKRKPPHRYYFRSSAPDCLTSGSKILFSFENQIFGEAALKEGVQALTPQDVKLPETYAGFYRKFVTIDPESIEIYKFHPTKNELVEYDAFEDYQFSQLFSYLNIEQYKQILRLAKR